MEKEYPITRIHREDVTAESIRFGMGEDISGAGV
jgi:hypothetical protein